MLLVRIMCRYNKVTVEKGGSIGRINTLQDGALLCSNNDTITYDSIEVITSI